MKTRNRRPSARNLEIYKAITLERRAVKEVAIGQQLSPQRILRICQSVETYLARLPSEDLPTLTSEEKGRHIRCQLISQLQFNWEEAMREWRLSQEAVETLKISTESPLDDAGQPKAGGKRKAEQT